MIRPLPPGWTRPVEAAEDTDELREALAVTAARYIPGPARHTAATELADDLLAGPLAPLLDKVQAVEELHQPWHRGRDGKPVVGSVAPEDSDSSTWCVHLTEPWPCATRRALGGESRG